MRGNYRKDINRNNSLGTRGEIAEGFAQLIRIMRSGQESIITPSQFKETIGVYANQFQGHDQHDSQEFLAFLLDGTYKLNLYLLA